MQICAHFGRYREEFFGTGADEICVLRLEEAFFQRLESSCDIDH